MRAARRTSTLRWCALGGVLLTLACSNATTGPPRGPDVSGYPIDRMLIFVRDWPSEYVEIDLNRSGGMSTLTVYRPPQPGVPRVLLDSIGPSVEDPPEIVELLKGFDIWAMADSNAVGAACSTSTGRWVCYPTFNDYSVVIGVTRGGQTRGQRYTRLRESTSSKRARALGDFVLAMAQRRTTRASRR